MDRLAATRAPRVGMAGRLIVTAAVGLGLVLHVAQLNPALAQSTEIHAWRVTADQSVEPGAAVWRGIPAVELPLTAQRAALPMGGGSIPSVEVRAVHSDRKIYIHLSWADATEDVRSDAVESFADAVAVQLPAVAGAAVPAICMGQVTEGVNIWQWRADSLPASAAEGYVDVPAGGTDLDYPARAAGNPMSDPDAIAVQNLVANGFGTLAPALRGDLAAAAQYGADGWAVVFERGVDAPGPGQPALAPQSVTDVVFAVWNGSEADRDGQKSVSAFATLRLVSDAPPSPAGTSITIGLMLLGLLAVIGIGSYVVGAPPRAAAKR